MIHLVVALKDEARPLIESLKLQHIPEITQFKVYTKEDIYLIISGVGKINSAVATTYLLSKFPNPNAIINFGICGCGDLHVNVGEILLANKIVDEGSGNKYFSEIKFKHSLREFTIHTYDKPVENISVGNIGVEMEGSGFFHSASKFLSGDKIFAVKVVSDHLDTKGIDATFVIDLIRKHIKELENFLNIFKDKQEKKLFSTLDKINLSSRIS